VTHPGIKAVEAPGAQLYAAACPATFTTGIANARFQAQDIWQSNRALKSVSPPALKGTTICQRVGPISR